MADVENPLLDNLSKLAEELEGALVGLALFKTTNPVLADIGGRPSMVMTGWNHDPDLFALRDNAIHRLGCLMYHVRTIVGIDDAYLAQARDAKTLLARPASSISNYLRDLLRQSATQQSYMLDDIVLHLMSLFEYLGNLTGYLFHGEQRRKLKWDGVVRASRNREWEVNKTGRDHIASSLASQRFVHHETEFVKRLEEYRANIFHYEMMLPKGSSSLSFRGFKKNNLTVKASDKMVKWLHHVVPGMKETELSLVETACRLVQAGLERILDVVLHLQQDMDIYKQHEHGGGLVITGRRPQAPDQDQPNHIEPDGP